MRRFTVPLLLLLLCTPSLAQADGNEALGLTVDMEIDGGKVWSEGVGISQRYGAPTAPVQTIEVNNLPQDAIIWLALLYWNTIGLPDDTAIVNGEEFLGTQIGHCQDTCWSYNSGAGNYSFRAEVQREVQGNGKYVVEGFNWQSGIEDNQGFSLVIIYGDPSSMTTAKIMIADGAKYCGAGTSMGEFTFTGFTVPSAVNLATATYMIGDSQGAADGPVTFAHNIIDDGDPFCGEDCAHGDGGMWDDDTYVVTQYVTPGMTEARFGVSDPPNSSNDCLAWVGAIFYYEYDNPNPDVDGDGFSVADGDCDDSNPLINPDATEVADGVDNDCDGQIDEGNTTGDEDDDEDGWTVNNGDCDDDDPTVNPGMAEDCDDGVDNDCDGFTDGDDEDCGGGGDDDTGGGDDDTSEDDDDYTPDGSVGDCSCTVGAVSAGSLTLVALTAVLGVVRRRR